MAPLMDSPHSQRSNHAHDVHVQCRAMVFVMAAAPEVPAPGLQRKGLVGSHRFSGPPEIELQCFQSSQQLVECPTLTI